MKIIDLLYDKAIKGIPGTEGIPGMGSVEEFARGYMEGDKSLEEKVDSLIRFQVAKASATGFITGIGGVITLPVAIPANLAGVFFLQLQMIAVTAHMGGYDVRDDRVRTFCLVCLCGEGAGIVMKKAGMNVGMKLTGQVMRNLSVQTIHRLNRAAGLRLLTKLGQTSVTNLGRGVPVIGGMVGGTFDGFTTYAIGKAAKKTFIEKQETGLKPGSNSESAGAGGWLSRISIFEYDESTSNNSLRDDFLDVEEVFLGRSIDYRDERRSELD